MQNTRRRPEIVKRPTALTIPQHAGPHVRLLFAEMRRQRVTYEDLEWRSGVLKNTTKAWRHKNTPNLVNIEACLGVLGWSLLPVPAAQSLPPEIVEKLQPIADEFGETMPNTVAMLIEIASLTRARINGVNAPQELRRAA